MSNDPRDLILQANIPALMVPRFGALPDLAPGAKRILLAADGVYLEVRSLALHACVRISRVPLPYGAQDEWLRPTHGPLERGWLQALSAHALAGGSGEVAAGLQWTERHWELVVPTVVSSSGSHVTYHDIFDDARLLLDMHSHGDFPPIFSATDDASDLGRQGPYLAVVIGNCTQPSTMRSSVRFVCAPYLIPLTSSDLTRLGAVS